MQGIQDTSSDTLRKLLGNGLRYTVPRFQRDYSWELAQWDDLWQDILLLVEGEESAHYMGYLVLQTNDNNKDFVVIDGQQRLTTLSILVLAVLKLLQNIIDSGTDVEASKKRLDTLRNSYIGYLDPVTLIPQKKLKLNRNNDEYYRDHLVPLKHLPVRNVDVSSALMRKCFQWFLERLNGRYTSGKELAAFVDTMVDKLFFTVIKVDSDLNAFAVFETLNSLGVRLSSADLLKNYLFSVVDKSESSSSEIDEVERLWSTLLNKLKGQRLPDFLRIFWNSRNLTARKTTLFKVIRQHITERGEVFKLLRDLNEDADLFMALRNPEDESWRGGSDVVRKYLGQLQLFNVQQPFPLLLGAYSVLPPDKFERLLRACVIISMRYNVIGGLNPNDQERTYNAVVLRIRTERDFHKDWLSPVYPQDENFKADFSNKILKNTSRNMRVMRYIVACLEKNLYGREIAWDSDRYSVEHIMPENPADDAWRNVADDEHKRSVYRLGNLTVLESKLNRKISNSEFADKLSIFAQSEVEMTKSIAEFGTDQSWGEQTIAKRQRMMAKAAVEIWKL